MLAESAHSLADCFNEVFLAIGLHRDTKPADAEHPLGHGRERFLWALMAAIATFLLGGCVSIVLAIVELRGRHPVEGGIGAWIVLAVAFVADGISWLQSLRQARRQAKDYGLGVGRYILRASDPVVRAVLFEDSAALVGLVIAAIGLGWSRMVGTNLPDSIASLVIGALLAVTAFGLARPLADFLVGRSIPAPQLERLETIVREDPAVESVVSLFAVYRGPEEVIVGAKVHPKPGFGVEALGRAMDDLDHRIREALPYVADVYVDVTARRGAEGATRA
jgi:cation diffusion facilitator family transporter